MTLCIGAFAITNTENEDHYLKALQFVDETLRRVFNGINLKFQYQMADGASFIRSGAKKYEPDITALMCKFHFWQAIYPKIYSKELIPLFSPAIQVPGKFKDHFVIIKNRQQQQQRPENNIRHIIKFDIITLEILPSKNLYIAYLKMVIPFWKHFAVKFYEYFWENYLNITNPHCLSGWQNFIKGTQPGTNNAIEGLNRAIKEFVTDHRKLEFGKYVQALCDELKEKSQEDASIANFPKLPIINICIARFALQLFDNFSEFFLIYEGRYFIKDKFVNYSLYNKKTGKVKKEVNQTASKLRNENEETLAKFNSYYSKPSIAEVRRRLKCEEVRSKLVFLKLLAIREVTVHRNESKDKALLQSSCTCPDFFKVHICHHLLACLTHEELYDPNIEFQKQKKRGRKPKNRY